MKYMQEFRDPGQARGLARAIAAAADPGRAYHFMEFCGGHTYTISRYGIPELLPAGVRMIHGPGCPVCVLPVGRIDNAIQIAATPGVTLCSYGDMLRVPGSHGTSLLQAKAAGADVEMVYSVDDALRIAADRPDREVVFFGIGFETTAPASAAAVTTARARGLGNFRLFCNHVLTPAAIRSILESRGAGGPEAVPLDGFIGPAHVSAVIGTRPFEAFAREYRKPVVVAGFEPLDVLLAILMLVRQVNEARHEVENEYARAVTRDGNTRAQALVAEVFEPRGSFEWRGLGLVPDSALEVKAGYAEFDAERRWELPAITAAENRHCECGAILRGLKQPFDCSLFGTTCTPDTPVGSCMVSSEGTCAAYYAYRRHRPA
ncbi:MAG: hydrogenase formation protein HypD [Acidobacteria bacterium]|nr:hydrogenase formation protein HypD [Acidobacteriota bacterium]